MNEIISLDNTNYSIEDINTVDGAKEFIKKLDTLEKLLKATDKWHENACKFCMLEAQALCRIAELNLLNTFKGNYRKQHLIEWLQELTQEKRDELIKNCFENGCSITFFYKQYCNEQDKTEAIEMLHEHTQAIMNDFKETGAVSIRLYDNYIKGCDRVLGQDVINDHIDGVRNKLLLAGGYGIEDGKGTYATAEKAGDMATEMLNVRIKGLMRDIESIKMLLEQLKMDGYDYQDYRIIEKSSPFSKELSDESIIHVLLCMLGISKPLLGGTSSPSARLKIVDVILKSVGSSIEEVVDCLIGASKGNNYGLYGELDNELLPNFTRWERDFLFTVYYIIADERDWKDKKELSMDWFEPKDKYVSKIASVIKEAIKNVIATECEGTE